MKANSKVIKSSTPNFLKGMKGKGHMVGKQSAGPVKPGSTMAGNGSGGGKFAKGGKGHMVGKQSVKPAKKH